MTLPNQIAPHAIQERCIRLIQTERLVLRAPRAQDAKTIAALVNDRRIAENTLRIPHPYGIADAQRFITGVNASSGETVFLIVRRDDTVLGACGVAERPGDSPELGYWLAFAFWGTGYATEAARAVIDYAFDDLGYEMLHAGAREQSGIAPRVGEMRVRVDRSRALSHPLARLVRTIRSISARAQALDESATAAWGKARSRLKLGT